MKFPMQAKPVARNSSPTRDETSRIAASDCCGAGQCCIGACLFGHCAGACVPNIGQC